MFKNNHEMKKQWKQEQMRTCSLYFCKPLLYTIVSIIITSYVGSFCNGVIWKNKELMKINGENNNDT